MTVDGSVDVDPEFTSFHLYLSLLGSYDFGRDRSGLLVSFRQALAQEDSLDPRDSGSEMLFESEVEVGYGLRLREVGLFTPYTGLQISGANGLSYLRGGMRLSTGSYLSFDASAGVKFHSAADAEESVRLVGRLSL